MIRLSALRTTVAGTLLLLALLFGPVSSEAQLYRQWVDTTLPAMIVPDMFTADTTIPLFLHILTFPDAYPVSNMWDYAEVMSVDYLHRWLYKDGDWAGRNTRYDDMLEDAPAGKGVLVWLGYPSYNGSFLGECARAREVLFFPFDSSQLRRAPVKTIDPREWVFTHYEYDTVVRNPSMIIDGDTASEALYEPSLANTIVASGISFRHDSLKVYRWKAFDSAGSWHGRPWDRIISSWNYFDHRAYYWYEMIGGQKKEYGDSLNEFREPNYIVVKGHLFEEGGAGDNDILLMIRVYYEVQRGETYRDSSNTLVTADTNLRFLYRTIGVTKSQLKPENPLDPDWNAYREVVSEISFRHNGGMGGPLDTIVSSAGAIPVTARGIDIEVEYMGGEKVALHAVGIRDSITNILMASLSISQPYYDSLTAEIQDISRADSNHVVDSAFLSIDLWDEPPPEQFAGFRKVDEHMRKTFSRPGGDSLAALHGDAYPHLQHLAYSDWVVMISYYGGGDAEAQNRWDAFEVPTDKIPAIPEHNGGRFSIPVLFPLDSLTEPGFIDVARDRIALMNESFQVGLYGEANPNETLGAARGSRAGHKYRHATETRLSGRRFKVTIGPTTSVKFTYDGSTRDTFAYHTPEASELRLLASFSIAYGAKAFEYYFAEHSPWVDTAADGGPVGWFEHGFAVEGLVEPTASIVDLMVGDRSRTPKWPINDFFAGYKAYYDEMQSMGVWLKRIGGHLLDLRWRDAYSVHWQARRPGNSVDSTRQPRLLPSNEIITSVTARHPITGSVDAAWQTYVELGLFDTKIDTTGGVRNVMNDTNLVAIVNRRIFETGNYDQTELGYSDSVKAVLDTLTETREITLEFNLANPDTNHQFNNFIRVRELAPDTATLPLIGSRQPLDTVVAYDINGKSKVKLVLGPGRAALLEITYTKPDESVVNARLDRNNQRKILYEPHGGRYYMTWHRYDTTQGDYHVYFRRSFPIDTLGPILWEPVEHHVSGNFGLFDVARTDNYHPSLTYRRINDTILIVSIVWTAHPFDQNFAGKREILLREVEYHDYYDSSGAPVSWHDWTPVKATVGYHEGLNPQEWGTPVISASGFGEYIAWSDSLVGIVARGLLYDASVYTSPNWTPPDTVNAIVYNLGYPPGKYPTLPPFSHRGINDSTCGIAWQQQDDQIYTGIYYGRLAYIPPTAGPSITIQTHPFQFDIFVSPYTGTWDPAQYLHPSIDVSQDAFGRMMEGVAYERYDIITLPGTTKYSSQIGFRAITLDTSTGSAALQGNNLFYTEPWGTSNVGYCYPVTSSENQILVPADSADIPLFATVYLAENTMTPAGRNVRLLEAIWDTGGSPRLVQDSDPPYKNTPETYTYSESVGTSGTGSVGNLEARYAAAYTVNPDSIIRTTREYFARARPGGYLADGREVRLRLDNSSGTFLEARLQDVWVSDDDDARGVAMTSGGTRDSLYGLLGRLRTADFRTSDSVRIGASGLIRLGPYGTGSMLQVDCLVELVDSTSQQVVLVLDSVRVDSTLQAHLISVDSTLDLLSGAYFVRIRLVPVTSIANRSLAADSTWSESSLRTWIQGISGRRAIRFGPVAGNSARISAQPNPFGDWTEIRFSIHQEERVSIVIVDASGREVARPVRDERFEAGRYAVEFETGNLVEGTYVMELRAGSSRAVEKLIVRR